MKTKKFEKPLSLNKKTIVDLNDKEMGNVKGGINDVPDTTKGTKFVCCATGCPGNSWCICW